ncbi:MAG: hypothetical protein H8D67_13820, partial [Deltaproteobacteria bacterium]|nr:hypothetical protein [Deltaproteobacteria bacterium]
MKQIMSILAIGLILTGCTTIRVSTDQRKDVKKIPIRKEITFREIKSPTIRDPHLSLQAEVRVTEEETFQRKINLHRRLGKTGWLISTGIAL